MLLGKFAPGNAKTVSRFFWPSQELFFAKFTHWDGEWNQACEDWFVARLQRISAGTASPLTLAEWDHSIKAYLRLHPAPPHPTSEDWLSILRSFHEHTGIYWNNKPLGSIIIPEHIRNRR
jgi:hypothetical protein